MWLGVDTGGTFTDFVLYDGQALRVHKVLSTPHAPERAILQGMRELGLDEAQTLQRLRIVHGSTVATNAVLEGKGARTAYIANYGLGDLLTIGRQNRAELYNLQPQPRPAPVQQALCLETGGRLGANGEVVEPLTETELQTLAAQLARLAPEAVAINLLFSFLDDRFERAIEAIVPEGVFVSRSSSVLPEYREYERGIATWLNARVGPLMQRYLQRLKQATVPAQLAIMQSSGGTLAVEQAARHAVRLLLSGPAGGLAGAQFIGAMAGCDRLLTFDMGGTSTDVALIDGEIALTNEGRIGPYPVAVPMVDLHTIGAGGGSLAYLDEGGMLQVGPQSAGADPGPVCYGRGGRQVTVTDANLILGRLRPEAFLGGRMPLDVEAAHTAMRELAGRLGLDVEQAARGIIDIANEHMARALRVMSVQRGVDPKTLTLTSFGGAGGLHVCALAEALKIERALVPVHGGVLSALGMLAAPRARELSRTLNVRLDHISPEQLALGFEELLSAGRAELLAEGAAEADIVARRSLDLRYQGQAHALNLPWSDDAAALVELFHARHAQRYGHALGFAVEVLNLRLSLRVAGTALPLNDMPVLRAAPGEVRCAGIDQPIPLWQRMALEPERENAGPALIVDAVSTTYLAPGWRVRRDRFGNLLLSREL
ncbi:MAG: hydantoinase/oxoprolinase family protein [Pseudomonadota bacterium]